MNTSTLTFETITGEFKSGFSPKSSKQAIVAKNSSGQYAFLKGESTPYSPIGGCRAIKEVNEMGALEFRDFSFE